MKFGGHAAAAGFTVHRERLDELRDRLSAHVAATLASEEDLAPRFRVDETMGADEVTIEAARELGRLEPHGIGNPRPLFLVENAVVRRAFVMKEKHLKLVLSGGANGGVEAVWWEGAGFARQCPAGVALDLVVQCGVNEWQGVVKPQLTVKDARLAAPR